MSPVAPGLLRLVWLHAEPKVLYSIEAQRLVRVGGSNAEGCRSPDTPHPQLATAHSQARRVRLRAWLETHVVRRAALLSP